MPNPEPGYELKPADLRVGEHVISPDWPAYAESVRQAIDRYTLDGGPPSSLP